MSKLESLGAEVKRRNEELLAYYKDLYNKDDKYIKEKAEEYAESHNDVAQAFIAGWKYAILQPPTRMIQLIVMYAYDYIPDFISVNVKHATTCIRDIFREKLYPKELFNG